ncbi:uncharacterized protein LOC115987987 isoform X1 [Quercus lobata]|uniref:uncharacterized protein LOC115987987 isoform X1 n=1 Tax=Quercus lobata TaxID=97700 RepID=UPI0012484AEC|nr:uncharacterized protein LOC115987987 isoform X1 [Quercus lobata]XP_030967465.1 uncharacterized protein LOC115987987 isoform X1 [Quercus lobata]XP_030967466.1 uncharacterized protein LOC115987987 isoform X1 [Quercus lobata]XP_030967467.1 uncharacterized protein LOC115987987 isoform X1 [Quercus lobata]
MKESLVYMKASAAKKNKNVQKVAALATSAIREGKLQLPTPGEKRKFIVDTSPKTFGTITRPKETPNHPSSTPACSASVDRLRVHDKGKGPFTPPKPPLLVQDASYAVEQALFIIKNEDIDDCDEYATSSIIVSELHDLIKAMVRMKILELRCKDYEDQVVALRKRLENNIEVIKGLSEFVSPLIEKVAILETKVKELEVQCASHVDLFIFPEDEKIHLSKELGKLQEELSNAKMRVVVKYSTS